MTDPIAEATQAGRVAERTEVVAWLRQQPWFIALSPKHIRAYNPRMTADAIERGDHATLDARSREDGDTRRQGEGRG